MYAVYIGSIIGAASALLALRTYHSNRTSRRSSQIDKNVAQFKQNYRELQAGQTALNSDALGNSPASWRASAVPMLTANGWVLDEPMPLSALEIRQDDRTRQPNLVSAAKLLDLDLSGPISYSQAVVDLAGKNHFTNGVIYRPTLIDFSGTSKAIVFERARYFEYLDTCEVLAYLTVEGSRKRYAAQLGSPFDLSNRICSLGILTLTLYESGDGRFKFFMHQRAGTVVLGPGLFHVVPAGEFTPSDVSKEAGRRDFDIRRNIQREFAEELLGHRDAQGKGSLRIDYENKHPYKELSRAEVSGQLRYHLLGIGLDPLTWKPELLTVAVFRNGSFEEIFDQQEIIGNFEGLPIPGNTFDKTTVDDYTESDDTRLGAKACLDLAWRHRAQLTGQQ